MNKDASAALFFKAALKITYSLFKKTNNTLTKNILVAGVNIRLHFAGEALMPTILPAIAHLIHDKPNIPLDYTIYIWDGFSTNTPLPQLPSPVTGIQSRGDISWFNDHRYHVARVSHTSMMNLLDTDDKKGIVCFENFNEVSVFEASCPLRIIFSWIMTRNDKSLIHAGAIGSEQGAVLIGGHGGSGKSSTTFRSLISGLNFFGDDLCAVSFDKNIPTVYSIYSSGKVHKKDMKNFPEFKDLVSKKKHSDFEKEILLFSPCYKKNLPLKGEIKAVIMPDFTKGGNLKFTKISLASVLSIMSASTKLLLPDLGNELFFILSSILHQVPCYSFNLGSDPAEIPQAIRKILKNPVIT